MWPVGHGMESLVSGRDIVERPYHRPGELWIVAQLRFLQLLQSTLTAKQVGTARTVPMPPCLWLEGDSVRAVVESVSSVALPPSLPPSLPPAVPLVLYLDQTLGRMWWGGIAAGRGLGSTT
jgi:hypothetical protein